MINNKNFIFLLNKRKKKNIIFNNDTFKDFSEQKLEDLMQNNKVKEVFELREKVLEHRKNVQEESLKKMLKNKTVSPKTFQHKKIVLEKWVNLEKENIKQAKIEIEKTLNQAQNAIKKVIYNTIKVLIIIFFYLL